MDGVPRLWESACEDRRQRLIEAIHRVFPKWPPPKGTFDNDDPYTCRQIEMHVLGKPWYELGLGQWFDFGRPGRSVDENSLSPDSTYMLTPAGWAYYVPAYMLMCVTAVDPDTNLDDVIAHMDAKFTHHDFAGFVSRLTSEQIEVCKEFLSFVAECHVYGGDEDAAVALSHWPQHS